MNWLDYLVQTTHELEPPERFWWWSGLAAISSIVRKNVWLDRFSYTLYPNVYVILVSARSGLRKGVPILHARKIVEILGTTRVIAGRNSIQGVVKDLSIQKTLESGQVLSDAHALLCAPELVSFVVKDPEGLNILLDLYNIHEHGNSWKNTLKNSPVEELKNPCLSLLGGMNEPMFNTMMHKKDIEGGFIARSFIVYEKNRRIFNDLLEEPKDLVSDKEYAGRISYIKELKGPFTISEEAKGIYRRWYKEISENQFDDKTGSLDRLGDQVLKVAMIVSLARGNDMIISEVDISLAIKNCQQCLVGVQNVTLGTSGVGDHAETTAMVIKELIGSPNHSITRRELLKRMKFDLTVITLDQIIDLLLQANAIEQPKRDGREICYRLQDSVYEQYVSYKKEEN